MVQFIQHYSEEEVTKKDQSFDERLLQSIKPNVKYRPQEP